VLPGVLRELYVGRKTGVLTFTRGDERRSVRVRGGHIVTADTTVREDRMGEVLVRHGLLPAADLKRAVGFSLRDNKLLGVVLMELGLLDERGLEQALALHVRAVLSRVFSWQEGSYEFVDETDAAEKPGDVTLRMSTGDLILEATRSVQDPDVVRYNLGDIDRVLGLSNDPLLRFQRIGLTPVDGYVLSRVDGTLSAREVMQLIPLPSEEVQRSLFGLLSTGVVEYLLDLPAKPAPPPVPRPASSRRKGVARRPAAAPDAAAESAAPPASSVPVAPSPVDTRRIEILEAYDTLQSGTHYDVLGIARDATEAQVKEAYFRMAKRFHPDVHHDEALHDLRDKLEAVFIRLGEAYEVLRNPRIRMSYERQLGPLPGAADAAGLPPVAREDPKALAQQAEEAIRRAARSVAEEKYWEAIQLLETSVGRVEGKMKQEGRVLLARAYAKNPNWVKQGEELLQTVIRDDPQNVDAHFHLAAIYRAGSLKSRAQAMLRRVLELEPGHEEARLQLEALGVENPQPPSAEPGLFKKLLRRK
jgi:tetratricopeptide (TPR) repeat protein